MSVFRHPHRIHGIVRTRMGAFAVSRGLVEAPDDVGETLGWRRVDCDDPPAVRANDIIEAGVSPAGLVDDQLGDVILAIRELLRSRDRVTVPSRGIDLVFDAGILAVCRECGVTWRVSRAHYRHRTWWSCPRGCSRAGSSAAPSPTA
jgi:hypothetical protein